MNLAISQYFNNNHINNNNSYIIHHTIDEFCYWACSPRHKGYTFIAHNGKGYDFQFIHEWLINCNDLVPKLTCVGEKILCLQVKKELNIRFIDSLSFIQQPLKAFHATFGLSELHKGYFPHYFNIPENQNYIGPYPSMHYYGHNSMTKKDKESFETWYNSVSNNTFNFQEEFIKYCRSDVDILRRSCIEFRKLFIEIANIDPFQYITIASVCYNVYTSSLMNENTFATGINEHNDVFSLKSINWLNNVAPTAQHACNGGEVTIDGLKAD